MKKRLSLAILAVMLSLTVLAAAGCGGDPWAGYFKVLVNTSAVVIENDGTIIGGRVSVDKVVIESQEKKIDGIYAVETDKEFTFSIRITDTGIYNINTMEVGFNGTLLTAVSEIKDGEKVVGYNYKTEAVTKDSTISILTPLAGAVA